MATISTRISEGVVILEVAGTLSHLVSQQVLGKIGDLLGQGVSRVLLDLRKASWRGEEIFATCLTAHKRVLNSGGYFGIIPNRDFVNFDCPVLDEFGSVSEALQWWDLLQKTEKIPTRRYSGYAVVDLAGDIVGEDGQNLIRKLGRLLQEGRTDIILNLGAVRRIDGSGLANLISSVCLVANLEGRLTLVNVNSELQTVLKREGGGRIFQIFLNEAEALEFWGHR